MCKLWVYSFLFQNYSDLSVTFVLLLSNHVAYSGNNCIFLIFVVLLVMYWFMCVYDFICIMNESNNVPACSSSVSLHLFSWQHNVSQVCPQLPSVTNQTHIFAKLKFGLHSVSRPGFKLDQDNSLLYIGKEMNQRYN